MGIKTQSGTGNFDFNRRRFLQGTAAMAIGAALSPNFAGMALADQEDSWFAGDLAHLIPTANHKSFLIKASFLNPRQDPPVLTVDELTVGGIRSNLNGRFWQFFVTDLEPEQEYSLRLLEAGGGAICDPWPLKTFPAPGTTPTSLRILAYTCAGGMDGPAWRGKTFFLDMDARRQLLARGMSFNPDLVIANGDHIYWDLKTSQNKPFAHFIRENYWHAVGGSLDITVPMLDPRNKEIYFNICDYQIPRLYGTTLRSTPSFFLTDDHDMFENDEFDSEIATLPPDTYGISGAETTQLLYYPEFLPDANRPDWLEGSGRIGRITGANMLNGSIRYGDLLEVSLYDCRRNIDYKEQHAKVVTQSVEEWLMERTLAEDTLHYFHAPSLPFGYSSGKLGDWYPDVLDNDTGKLVLYQPKAGWQWGWFAQHQRLTQALASQKKRAPVVVQGDLHASSAGKILRSGEILYETPIHLILSGPLGTGDYAFPSSARDVESSPSQLVDMDEILKPLEKNGFSIIDVTENEMRFSLYTWRPPQAVEDISTMEPTVVYTVPRPS